jgi:hypothetical protein
MAKSPKERAAATNDDTILRQPAEIQYRAQLEPDFDGNRCSRGTRVERFRISDRIAMAHGRAFPMEMRC